MFSGAKPARYPRASLPARGREVGQGHGQHLPIYFLWGLSPPSRDKEPAGGLSTSRSGGQHAKGWGQASPRAGWCLCCFGGKSSGMQQIPRGLETVLAPPTKPLRAPEPCLQQAPAASGSGVPVAMVCAEPQPSLPSPSPRPYISPPAQKSLFFFSPDHCWLLQEVPETQPSSPSVGTSSGNSPGCDRAWLNPWDFGEESGKRQLPALSCTTL